jgi:hypothetical protein
MGGRQYTLAARRIVARWREKLAHLCHRLRSRGRPQIAPPWTTSPVAEQRRGCVGHGLPFRLWNAGC